MICINLIRVSPDSKYLDINVETQQDYRLSSLIITRFNGFSWEHSVDASEYIPDTTNPILRLDTSIFGGTGLFKIEMMVKWVGEDEEPYDECGNCQQSKEVTSAYASDVSMVYKYLVTKLISMNCNCYKLDEDLERNFMFLYAHQEAMQMGRISEAVKFYSALYKNFNKCGPKPGDRIGTACVCQTRPVQPVHYKNNCGCHG